MPTLGTIFFPHPNLSNNLTSISNGVGSNNNTSPKCVGNGLTMTLRSEICYPLIFQVAEAASD
ncbi:hypothetical protein [Parapedobacter indicus]|uniref:hypothetical protein n=1 Tax=Parapedobacter indicus TaxID=1477437 RepID=UPI0011603763|nr:hypothetical protein [Parapedobacter indicus]